MSARSPVALFAVLPSVLASSGCCSGILSLNDKECFYQDSASGSAGSSSTSPSTGSTTQEPSTSDQTTSSSSSESGSGTESGSSGSTTGGVCGDGTPDPGEACDDGNQTPADGCENDCTVTKSVCGDGKVDGTEQCEDGNDDNTDGCISCVFATCGDGFVHAGVEQCDDGANNGMYGFCADDCSGPGLRCGDGKVNGSENCDDGNQVDEDDCSNECVAPRYVFVTAGTFTGNLSGLTGADEKCAISGDSVVPGATWIAWLSDDTKSASMRLDNDFTGYYRLPGMNDDKPVIAKGWAGLTSGTLLAPINRTQTGAVVGDPLAAWTDTAQNGSKTPGQDNCINWTSVNLQQNGRAGEVGQTNKGWTDDTAYNCGTSLRLYCFQN